jgi:hypothetical protein
MAKAVLDRRTKVADLASAVVTIPGERQHVHGLVFEQRRDPVVSWISPPAPRCVRCSFAKIAGVNM